jgi:hypothetical protein
MTATLLLQLHFKQLNKNKVKISSEHLKCYILVVLDSLEPSAKLNSLLDKVLYEVQN